MPQTLHFYNFFYKELQKIHFLENKYTIVTPVLGPPF